MLRVDRPEVALAGPEHDGYDVHSHLVDQARGKHLATDVASGETRSPASSWLRLRHDDHVVDPARRLPVPAVRHVEDVAADDVAPIWSQ